MDIIFVGGARNSSGEQDSELNTLLFWSLEPVLLSFAKHSSRILRVIYGFCTRKFFESRLKIFLTLRSPVLTHEWLNLKTFNDLENYAASFMKSDYQPVKVRMAHFTERFTLAFQLKFYQRTELSFE
eukprot:snap_masked-scaffold_8-processed-gene-0.9-mRNA-1 protein AED:1.00 eAED:1.00 QI:0/-1/0/0/-1/1/1/0/126